MSSVAILLAMLFAHQATAGAPPRITRSALASIEKGFDIHIERANLTDPFDLLGNTRGVYIEDFGVVFSAELNLIVSPNLSPFHQSFTRQEIARIHERKVARLPLLRQHMREMMITTATSLENLPPTEQIVLAVSLFHYSWEDSSGIPAQIVMQAQRQQLLSNATRDSAIRTVEY